MAAFSLLILYLLFTFLGDTEDIAVLLSQARWDYLGLAVGLMALNMVIAAQRFRSVLFAMDFRPGLRRTLDALLSVWPIGLIIPSRGNDLLRAVVLRDEIPPWKCSGAVLTERYVDVQTLCMMAAVGCAAIELWWWAAGLAAGWIGLWCAFFLISKQSDRLLALPLVERFRPKIEKLLFATQCIQQRPVYFGMTILLSILAWLNTVAIIGVLLAGFGESLSWQTLLALWPLATFVGMVPATVAGMGTRDAAFVALLALYGVDVWQSAILAATMSYSVVVAVIPALVGLPLALRHIWRG